MRIISIAFVNIIVYLWGLEKEAVTWLMFAVLIGDIIVEYVYIGRIRKAILKEANLRRGQSKSMRGG